MQINEEHVLKISSKTYPRLFQMKKREREKAIKNLFKSGYDLYFPERADGSKMSNHDLLQQFELLRNDMTNVNPELNQRLLTLELTLNKLIGLSNSSSKKGAFAENMLEQIFKERYGDLQYNNTAQTEHSGDAFIILPDNSHIMLESKNYINKVNKDEVDKMERDMINHHILWGVFISWNSCIQGKREFDLHIFTHNGELYHIAMISNLSKDLSRLDLGLQVIRKIKQNYGSLEKFPWIVTDISNDLNQLNDLIKLNYKLRDSFEQMDSNIRECLNIFYSQLREYQYQLAVKTDEILKKIDSTMEKSLMIQNNNHHDIIKKYSNKKVFTLLCRLIDLIIDLKWEIIDKNSIISIIKDGHDIGIIKVYNKKIQLCMDKPNISFEFVNDKNIDMVSETLGVLKIIGKDI